MRQEDKEVDGFELERQEERKRESELIEEDDEEIHDLDGKPAFEREEERTRLVSGAMRKILERDHIVINDIGLSRHEQRALDAFKTAVEGRDQEHHTFVFAEDRRALLEQALAVLQPDIVGLEQIGGDDFETLVKEVAELRAKLNTLQDAQAEVEHHADKGDKGEAGDTDDKPGAPKEDDTSLTGPERTIAKPASSLSGPELKEEKKAPSSLTNGPEVKGDKKPATTLVGPELKAEPKPPTSLGDPKEIDEAAKKPWWRRLTGG